MRSVAGTLLYFAAIQLGPAVAADAAYSGAARLGGLASFLVGGVVCLAARSLVVRGRETARTRRASFALACLLVVLGSLCALAENSSAAMPFAFALVNGLLLGAGDSLLFVLAGSPYTKLPPKTRLAHVAASFALGTAGGMAAAFLLDGAARTACAMALQLGACALLAPAVLEIPEGSRREDPAREIAGEKGATGAIGVTGTTGTTGPASSRVATGPALRGMWARQWPAAVGLAVFPFVLGAHWQTWSLAVRLATLPHLAVALLAGALLVAAGLARRPAINLAGIRQAALPLAATLLLADPFLTFIGAETTVASGASWTICLVVFASIAWTSLACDDALRDGQAADHGGGVAHEPAFSAGYTLWATAAGPGVVAGALVDPPPAHHTPVGAHPRLPGGAVRATRGGAARPPGRPGAGRRVGRGARKPRSRGRAHAGLLRARDRGVPLPGAGPRRDPHRRAAFDLDQHGQIPPP